MDGHHRYARAFLPLLFLALLLTPLLAGPARAADDDLAFAQALSDARHFALARRILEAVAIDASSDAARRDDARFALALLPRAEARAVESEARFVAAADALAAFLHEHPESRHDATARRERVHALLAGVTWACEVGQSDVASRFADDALKAASDLAAGAPLLRYRAHFERARLAPEASAELEKLAARAEALRETHAGTLTGREAEQLLGEVLWELARRVVDPGERFGIAFSCFAAGLEDPHRDAGRLTRVSRAYRCLAELAVEAASRPEGNALRVAALDLLEKMPRAEPAIGHTKDGLRAWIAWSRLLSRAGRAERALEAALQAEAYAMDPRRWRERDVARHWLIDCWREHASAHLSPDLLLQIAEHQFLLGEYATAILVYRRVIASTPSTAEAFLAWRWRAWERMARAYRALDDRLAEALALEPVHEAWLRRWIPYDPYGSPGENITRATQARRRSESALHVVAEQVDSAVFRARLRSIRDAFLRDYPERPSHPTWNVAVHLWREARELLEAGDERGPARLEEAYILFVGVSEDPHHLRQDAAWVYRVRARWVSGRYEDALAEADRAWAWWRSDAARELAATIESARHRQAVAQAATIYLSAYALSELDRHLEVIEKLEGYATRHPTADEAYRMLAQALLWSAHTHVGDADAAERTLADLVEAFPQWVESLGLIAFVQRLTWGASAQTPKEDILALARRTLESILVDDPADFELVDGMLANRIVILRQRRQGIEGRLPIPRCDSVSELRRALRELAAKDEDRERGRTLLALADSKDGMLRNLVPAPGQSSFAPDVYRDLANPDPLFRVNLAWVYTHSHEPGDEWRARNLVGSLLSPPLAVEEECEIWWRARALDAELGLRRATRAVREAW